MSKPCAFKGQPLTSHIEGTLKIAKMFIEEGYQDTLSFRLAKASSDRIDYETFRSIVTDMVEISAIFHDIGKALKAYQDNYDHSCSCIGRSCSFPYHEIFSALYLYKLLNLKRNEFLEKVSSGAIVKQMIVIPLISVINHMHGLRSYKGLKRVDSRELYKVTRGNNYIERGHAEELSRKIIKLKDTFYGVKIDESELINILSARLDNLDGALNSMREEVELVGRHRWAKLYNLILAPLIIGDSCDSVENRISDPNEHTGRKAYIWELCCNSLGYYLKDSISGLKICDRGWQP